MGYIYKIINDINGKMYIGKTEYTDPNKRWKEHLGDYKKRKCEKRPLYDAMNKYGIEHFHFEIIEETNYPEEREQYWINELHTYVGFEDCNGYNATLGGDGKSYLNLNEDEVIKYHTEEANYITGRTAKHFSVDSGTIKKILNKNNINWLNNDDVTRLRIYETHGGLYQIDTNSKLILNIFENVVQANIYLGKDIRSYTICNACNKNHYAYGYLWYYGKDLHLIQDKLIDTTWF